MTGLMALVAFTPLNHAIIAGLVGAPPALVPDAIVALQILAVFPLLMAVRQFYQSMTMNQRKTRRVAMTAFSRLLMMASFLFVLTPVMGWTGAGRGGRGPNRGDGHGGSGGLPGGTSFCGNGFRYAGERQQAGVIPHGPLEVGG